MLNESNTHELAQIAKETGALVFRDQLSYPGPGHSALPTQRSPGGHSSGLRRDCAGCCAQTGEWEIGFEDISDVLWLARLVFYHLDVFTSVCTGDDPQSRILPCLSRERKNPGRLNLLPGFCERVASLTRTGPQRRSGS